MDVRAELGQASWVARQYRDPRRWPRQFAAVRGIRLPRLPNRRRVPGSVWAVTMVKDEADVIGLSVQHLLDQGVDHVVVSDNGSTDGTADVVRSLPAYGRRVHIAYDCEPAYYQSEKMTYLAHRAWRWGADWVVPFDADEFWFARGQSLAEHLRGLSAGVGIVRADFHHMVPTIAHPPDLRDATFLLDSTSSFPGKVAIRSHPLAEIIRGNHDASRVGEVAYGLAIAHAIYRGPHQLARKVRQGTAAAVLTGRDTRVITPHWQAASGLTDAEIADVFENVSAGLAEPRIQWNAVGPMVRTAPLRWAVWDENGDLAGARPSVRL